MATVNANPEMIVAEPKIYFNPHHMLDGIDHIESLNLRKIEILCENSEENEKLQEAYNELRHKEKQLADMKVQTRLMNAQIERLTERGQGTSD